MSEITKVESSNIEQLEYYKGTGRLIVTFKGGRRYQYLGVPEHLHKSMCEAESVGKFFAREIRNTFKGIQIEDAPETVDG